MTTSQKGSRWHRSPRLLAADTPAGSEISRQTQDLGQMWGCSWALSRELLLWTPSIFPAEVLPSTITLPSRWRSRIANSSSAGAVPRKGRVGAEPGGTRGDGERGDGTMGNGAGGDRERGDGAGGDGRLEMPHA